MARIVRYVLNVFISAAWLWAFQKLGWVTFTKDVELWQAIAIVALITCLVQTLVGIGLTVFFVLTCLFLPVVLAMLGWVYLWGAAAITGWFTINVSFWWTGLLMSIAYGLVRIPDLSASSSSASSSD